MLVSHGGLSLRRCGWFVAGLVALLSLGLSSTAGAETFSWSRAVPMGTTRTLWDISCPSTVLCVAVDSDGNVLTSTDPGAGTQASWTATSIDGGTGLTAVSCPATSLCVAVDGSGNALTSADPTGGARAWTEHAVGDAPQADSGQGLIGVSCPSVELCIAIGYQNGMVYASTDPTAGAWSSTNLWTAYHSLDVVESVSCPSVELCVVGDGSNDVVTSTDPAGGINAWTPAKIPTGMDVGAQLWSMSCPSISLCVTGDDQGDIFSSTNPTGGAHAWKMTPISDGNSFDYQSGISDISCPSVSLCVGVDQVYGNAFVTADPAGGARAWSSTPLDRGNTGGPGVPSQTVDRVSCPSVSLCVAIDAVGNAFIGRPSHGCTAPSLKGKTLKQVRASLTQASCRLGKISKRRSREVRKGYALSQNPPAGKLAGSGVVSVVLSGGP